MAFTTTYSFTQIFPKTPVPTFGSLNGSNSDTVGLSGGGWATSVTDTSGFSDVTFYSPTGTVVGHNFSFASAGGRLARLTNGNVVVVGTPSAGGVQFAIDTPTGTSVTSGSITSNANESNADVAALAGGGFVVVDQDAFTAPDHDIEVRIRDASGNAVNTFAVDASGADDENASVAGLADGGFAVAWDRTDTSGNSSVWYAVYNADGSVRTAETELDGFGSINSHPNVTSLKSGGFTIGYEDNGWDSTQPDITVANLDSNGTFQNWVRASSLTSVDSEASVATLSNGLVMSTFTNDFNNGGDLDIRGTLIDPTSGLALTSISSPVNIDFSGDHTSASSIAALNLAQFAVSYTNATTNAADLEAFQLVRKAVGTTGADTFVGDDAVNDVTGFGGDDKLTGGANADVLNGGNGNDQLFGLAGADLLIGGPGDDVLNGGNNLDTASYGTATTPVTVNLTLSGPQNTGGGGVDTLVSIENLIGGSGNDTLTGSDSATTANHISGGAGNDVITGLAGGDTLLGGAGADTFVYKKLADSTITGTGRDKISDFRPGTDKIDLSALDANTIAGGNQAFTYIGTAHFTGTAGQLDTVHVGNNTLVEGDVNGDKKADFLIQLTGNLSVASTDFVL